MRLLTGDPDRVTDEDPRIVQALRERSPSIATAADLITRFCGMVKGRSPDPFEDWLRAALSEPWSSGQVEGHVNRLKATKRTMYGRAGFDLLRARVLGHA